MPRPRGLRGDRRAWVLLGALFVVHAVTNIVWIQRDRSLRGYDSGPHIEARALTHAIVVERGLDGLATVVRGEAAGLWPSAGYLPFVAVASVFGTGVKAQRTANLLFSALLLVSVFLLGTRIHSRRAGLLAAAAILLFPGVYGESRLVGVDFPCAAITAASMLLLLRTERLSRVGPALLLGVVLGAGMLLRPQVVFFLGAPGLALLGLALVRPPAGVGRARVLGVSTAALAAALLVSGVWWFGRLDELVALVAEHRRGDGKPLSVTLGFFLRALPWVVSPLLLALLAVAHVGLASSRRASRRAGGRLRGWLEDPGYLLLWLGVLGGFALHCQLRVRCMRYLVPLCPMLAVLIGAGLASIRRRRVRQVNIAIGLGLSVLVGLVDSFRPGRSIDFSWPGSTVRPGSEVTRQATSGPPRAQSLVIAAGQIGEHLRRQHGDGRGVLLHLFDTVEPPGFNFRLGWHFTPVIRVRMPLYRAAGHTYYGRRFAGTTIGGVELPLPADPPRVCYLLSRSRTRSVPRLDRFAGRVEVLELTSGAYRFRLWKLPCAPELERIVLH